MSKNKSGEAQIGQDGEDLSTEASVARPGTVEVEALDIVELDEDVPQQAGPPPLPRSAHAKAASEEIAAHQRAGQAARRPATAAESSTADGLDQLVEALNDVSGEEVASPAPEQPPSLDATASLAPAHQPPSAGDDVALPVGASQERQEDARQWCSPGSHPLTTGELRVQPGCYLAVSERIVWHQLDYREAALLAQMDGQRDRDTVIAAAELDLETGLRMLDGLIERGLAMPVEFDGS